MFVSQHKVVMHRFRNTVSKRHIICLRLPVIDWVHVIDYFRWRCYAIPAVNDIKTHTFCLTRFLNINGLFVIFIRKIIKQHTRNRATKERAPLQKIYKISALCLKLAHYVWKFRIWTSECDAAPYHILWRLVNHTSEHPTLIIERKPQPPVERVIVEVVIREVLAHLFVANGQKRVAIWVFHWHTLFRALKYFLCTVCNAMFEVVTCPEFLSFHHELKHLFLQSGHVLGPPYA